jgi:hypothetical protein
MDARKQKYTLRSKYYEKAMNREYGCVESGSAVPQIHVSWGMMNERSFTVVDFWRGPLNPCGMWSDELAGKEFYLSSLTRPRYRQVSSRFVLLLSRIEIEGFSSDGVHNSLVVLWDWNTVRRMNINTTFGLGNKPTILRRDSFEEQ